jgi:hypothetical protein
MPLTKASAGVLNIDDLYGFRNRVINGDMRIDQRNAGANVAIANNASSYITDRFRADAPADQSMTFQQQTSVVPTGFTNALKVTAGTATTNVSNQPGLFHFVEGYNTADLGFGTANAKTITLSFWVRSSLTGTFGVCFENNDGNRAYIASYTINVADTFEYKTITIAGDTSGTWNTTNQRGISVIFDLGYGTTWSAAASSAWANLSNDRGLTGGAKLAANTGATWYMTGCQLEVGSTATNFDVRSYGTELALCQRYCNVYGENVYTIFGTMGFAFSGTGFSSVTPFPVEMRAIPTVAYTGNTRAVSGSDSISVTSAVFNTSNSNKKIALVEPAVASGLTTNRGYFWSANADATARAIFSAEL